HARTATAAVAPTGRTSAAPRTTPGHVDGVVASRSPVASSRAAPVTRSTRGARRPLLVPGRRTTSGSPATALQAAARSTRKRGDTTSTPAAATAATTDAPTKRVVHTAAPRATPAH